MQPAPSGLEATSKIYTPKRFTACPLSIESKLDGTTASITPRADRWKDAWADR